MKGAFICPHCRTEYACTCDACKPFVEEGEPLAEWTEDGNALICNKCKKVFTMDESMDIEYAIKQEALQQSKNQNNDN